MTRHRAALIHLLLSILVASSALTLMLMFIYPIKYFMAGGGVQLLTILTSVDIIIGPMLTWLVYKAGKKSLRMDLTIIVLLQLSALVYGIWVILSARPVFMALVADRFSLVQANEISDDRLQKALFPEFRTLSWTGPVPVVTLMPDDPDRQQEVLMNALAGVDRDLFPEFYYPYDTYATQSLVNARPVADLIEGDSRARSMLQAVAEDHGLELDQLVFLPLVTKRDDMTTVLHYRSGEILSILDIDPWGDDQQ